MTPKELRAAATTLTDCIHKAGAYDQWDNLILVLTEHVLSAVREDDGEPFTFEWMANLPTAHTDGVVVRLGQLVNVIGEPNLIVDGDDFGEAYSTVPKTRGQFRRLCEGLGIVLGENER